MKNLFLIFLIVTSSTFTCGMQNNSTSGEPIAVIELFTSQGCSSCPAADKLLSETISDSKKDGRNIFVLSYHVDYWNRLGWSDPLSDEIFTDRQKEYVKHMNLESLYTPQAVVNGKIEFIGSNKSKLNSAISNALTKKTSAVFKNLIATTNGNKSTHLHFELTGNFENCDINFALVSNKETTVIKRGENGGRTLINENVVRQLISLSATSKGEIDFLPSPVPAMDNLSVIAFVQNKSSFEIIAAARGK